MTYNTKQARLFWGSILLCLLILTFLAPYQIINSDSVAGWEAFKGSILSGKFNTAVKPNPANISSYDYEFLTWWTPGQYMAPQFIKSVFQLSIGHSVVLLNIITVLLGLVGFYRLFKHYQFSLVVNVLSLLLIVSSNTLLYRFISYQGGESLSFLFFPWALYWFVIAKNKWVRNILVAIFLIVGFISKSQMLIALAPAFFLHPLAGYIHDFYVNKKQVRVKQVAADLAGIFIAALIAGILVYKYFISRGSNPSEIYAFNPSLIDTLIPLASPVTVMGNLYDIIFKVCGSHYMLAVCLLVICTCLTLFVFKSTWANSYGLFVFLYYLSFSILFLFLYYFDSKIDYNARHFKFVGYLFFPLLISTAHKYFSWRLLKIAVAAIILFALYNHYRLSKVWFNDTYVTKSDFRLNKTELPQEIYERLMDLNIKENILFFSPFESRWAIDQYDFICINNAGNEVYKGHGLPVLYVETDNVGWQNRVKNKLQGYTIESYEKVNTYLLVKLK